MLLNALFPTRDIGTDPAKIRDWAQAAEDLGYHCIEVADHVFGAAPRGDWKPIYSEHDPFHETFTTMAFIAAVTKTIKLCSGVLILPQRQTGLVAKQAAEVDILSGGRLRLGVGVGWNHVEYEALGTEWKTRGARQAEQIEVMRRLWTEDLVTFDGQVPQAGRRQHPAACRCSARSRSGSADRRRPSSSAPPGSATAGCRSWRPMRRARRSLPLLREHLKSFGRDPATFGLEGWLRMDDARPAALGRRPRRAGSGSAPRW